MLRAMRLRRVRYRVYVSRDGKWRFEFWDAVKAWFVYRKDEEPGAEEGFSDEPATGNRFERLWKACDWAAAQE